VRYFKTGDRTMARKYLRFLPPLAFAGAGALLAMFVINIVVNGLITRLGSHYPFSLTNLINGPMNIDVEVILTYIVPLILVEYLILGIPIAAILLLVTKVAKGAAYEIDIIKTGSDFGGLRMIRRAVVPALFSLALAGILSSLLSGLIFTPLTLDPWPAGSFDFYQALMSTMSSLIVLPVVLAFFIPTWILNDAGLTVHLKEKELNIRRCPDTIGVGRWWSNLLGGFTLLTVPIVSFVQNFYNPVILDNQIGNAYLVVKGLFLSIGIPVLLMAFVIPAIVLNEIFINLSKGAIRRIARKIGAKDLMLQTVMTPTVMSDKE
jgi:hypothetical protein